MADLGFGMVVKLRDSFSGVASKVGRSANKLTGVFGKVSGSMRGVSSGFGSIMKMAGLGVGVHQMIVDPLAKVLKFQGDLRSVRNLLFSMSWSTEKVAETMAQVEDASRQMSKEVGIDTKTLLEGFWTSFSSGAKDFNQAHEWVSDASKTWATFGVEVPLAIQLATDIFDNYGDEVGSTIEVMNKLAVAQGTGKLNLQEMAGALKTVLPLAKASNVSWEETVATLAALTRGTGNASESATKLRAMLSTLITARKSPAIINALRQMGVVINEDTMKARGLMGTLNAISEGLETTKFVEAGIKVKELGMEFTKADLEGDKLYLNAVKMAEALKALPAGKQKAALNSMGIQTRRLNLDTMDLKKTTVMLADAMRAHRFVVFRDQESLQGFLALTNKGGKQIGVFTQTVEAMAGAGSLIKERFDAAMEGPGRRLAKLKSRFDDLKLSIGIKLLPSLITLMDKFDKMDWTPIVTAIGTLADILPGLVDVLAGIANAGGGVAKVGGDVAEWVGISRSWGEIGAVVLTWTAAMKTAGGLWAMLTSKVAAGTATATAAAEVAAATATVGTTTAAAASGGSSSLLAALATGLVGGAATAGLVSVAGMVAVAVWDAERTKIRRKLEKESRDIETDKTLSMFGDKDARQRLDLRRNKGVAEALGKAGFADSGSFAALTAPSNFVTARDLIEGAGGSVGQFQLAQMAARGKSKTGTNAPLLSHAIAQMNGVLSTTVSVLQQLTQKPITIQLDGRTIYDSVLGRVELEAGRS